MKANNKEKILHFIGWDFWDRPVYKDDLGNLWKDVNPRKDSPAELYDADEFDSEPGWPIEAGIQVKFDPQRMLWN